MYALKNKRPHAPFRAQNTPTLKGLKAAATFVCLLVLSGCTTPPAPAPEAPQKQPELDGTWHVKDCFAQTMVDHVVMKTDGDVSNNTIRMVVQLPEDPQNYLDVSLLGVGGVDLHVLGRHRNWAFELPNTPYAEAQMITGRTYLLLTYTPVPTSHIPAPAEKTVVFPLKDLPVALAEQESLCFK